MKVIVVGIGKMGAQIAERFIKSGHQVVAIDPNPAAVAVAAAFGATMAKSPADAIQAARSERVLVWLMIPAKFVTNEIAGWGELLAEGSIIIDGGNTDFRETREQAASLAKKDITLLDVGVSGGILGNDQGFSLMVGGDKSAYQYITPLLEALSTPRGGYEYFGETGSGHYVKMIHNAIEYGMMESLAEGYRMLREGPYDELNLGRAGDVWQKSSVIQSTLNGLAAQIMSHDQTLADASGYVAESGEARWTLEIAREANIELPAIQAAFDVRLNSQQGQTNYTTKLLAELRNKFGGHPLNGNG